MELDRTGATARTTIQAPGNLQDIATDADQWWDAPGAMSLPVPGTVPVTSRSSGHRPTAADRDGCSRPGRRSRFLAPPGHRRGGRRTWLTPERCPSRCQAPSPSPGTVPVTSRRGDAEARAVSSAPRPRPSSAASPARPVRPPRTPASARFASHRCPGHAPGCDGSRSARRGRAARTRIVKRRTRAFVRTRMRMSRRRGTAPGAVRRRETVSECRPRGSARPARSAGRSR